MCGRFSNFHAWSEVHDAYDDFLNGEAGRNTPARYNIAPTQDVLFIAGTTDGARVMEGRWWLVPFWTKELQSKYPAFNARSETAHEKATFRDSFKSKRCLVPASGWYEWTKNTDDGGKDPWNIGPADKAPFSFAGLWAHNSTLDITSCTILTAPAADAIKGIHHRMPIVLKQDRYEQWLHPETTVDAARDLLTHHRGDDMTAYRVSREVNSSKSEGAHLIEPVL